MLIKIPNTYAEVLERAGMERPPTDLHEAALRLIASIEANLEVLRASGTETELASELERVLTAIRAELGEPEALVARQPKP